MWQRQTSQIMDLKKVCADKYLLQQQLKWLKDNKKKNSSIKPSVMVSATPYNFFTSLPFINEDGKTPKDVFSQQQIITASLKSEQFTKKQNNIILFWVIFRPQLKLNFLQPKKRMDLTIVAKTDLTEYGFKKSICADKYLLQQQLKWLKDKKKLFHKT